MSRQGFYEHDNRGPSSSKNVKYFNNMGRQKKFRDQRGGYGKTRIDIDGDVDMNVPHAPGPDRRYNPYSQRNNRRKGKKHMGKSRSDHGNMSRDSDSSAWYKITVPHGRKSGKDFILRSIAANCKVPFSPFSFQFNGHAAEFYVNEYSAASHIKDVSRKVSYPDGFKMLILMSRSAPPNTSIDPLGAIDPCIPDVP
ncbi:nuclear RNA export factor 1-like [Uloborus diversus]|uniref:nuclear RNA export factor 1-like n=1 Tax=Uloborus diversus TaxID=327109 RepID=UPI00240A8861|nr:nuclear RNA export factor 1-like [Uloborus diversus]